LSAATSVIWQYAPPDRSWTVSVTGSVDDAANGVVKIPITPSQLATNSTENMYSWSLNVSGGGDTLAYAYGDLDIAENLLAQGLTLLTNAVIDWSVVDSYLNGGSGPAIGDGTTVTWTTNATGQLVFSSASGGDVTGPASAGDEKIAVYDGTTGKIIKDGSSSISDITTAYTAADTVVSNGVTSGYQAGDALLLPLSGGTMAGNIAMSLQSITGIGGLVFGSSGGNVYGVDDNDFIGLFGGATNSAGILVYGSDHPTNPGDLWLVPYGGVVDIFGNAQIQGTLDMTNNAISGVSSVTFETNSTSHSSGTLNGTNGVFYTQNGTNYWILFN